MIFSMLCACAKKETPSCRELIVALTDAEIGLPAGRIYCLLSEEGDPEFFSQSLINSLFGGGEKPVMADGWLDCAVFLSSGKHPCEFAAFFCDSPDSADDTAKMLCRRLSSLKTAKSSDEYDSFFNSACVMISKNYVFLIISSDTDNAKNILRGVGV
jgi:hypothetical protein